MRESAELQAMINGALAAGFLVAAAFFLKFWRRTKDGLFAAFALAFAMLGLAQPLPALLNADEVGAALLYLTRFVAFSLIIIAVLRKNRQR